MVTTISLLLKHGTYVFMLYKKYYYRNFPTLNYCIYMYAGEIPRKLVFKKIKLVHNSPTFFQSYHFEICDSKKWPKLNLITMPVPNMSALNMLLFHIKKNRFGAQFTKIFDWKKLEFPIPREIVFLEEWGKWGITISIPWEWGISFFIPWWMKNQPFLLEDPPNSTKFLFI